jgi:hypothetical protein
MGVYDIPLRRDAAKAAARFHQRWLNLVQGASSRTLRRVCHEIATLEEMNREYRDGQLFRLLRSQLEQVIRELGPPGCRWSVERSRKDLRGQTLRRSQPSHVNRECRKALRQKLSLLDEGTEP